MEIITKKGESIMDNTIKYVVIENANEAFVNSLKDAGIVCTIYDELPTVEVVKEVEKPVPEIVTAIMGLIKGEVDKETAKVVEKYGVYKTAFDSLKGIVAAANGENTIAIENKE